MSDQYGTPDDPMMSYADRQRDPELKATRSAADLFGYMVRTPDAPMPPLATHPTKGICLSCRKPIPNAWFGFVGDWCAHHRCDACAAKAKVPPQPIRQFTATNHNDRTESRAAA